MSLLIIIMVFIVVVIVFFLMVNYLVLVEKCEYKLGFLILYLMVVFYFVDDFDRGEKFVVVMIIVVERLNVDLMFLVDYNVIFEWKDIKCNELIVVCE